MTAKADKSVREAEVLSEVFTAQVMVALEHFADAAWLAQHSPLAAPYLLGVQGLPADTDRQAHGRELQRLILDVAATLDGASLADRAWAQLEDEPMRWSLEQRLLYWSYFASALHGRKPLAVERIVQELGVSRATYYRMLPRVMQQLATALLLRLRPALRLDIPPALRVLVARDELLDRFAPALATGASLALLGPSGLGKTALAAALAARCAPRPVFWFALRVGLNDRLNSLLFALAYFLQHHGAAAAWQQLLADRGRVNLNIIPGLLRQDLARHQPVLCIDDLDTVRPHDLDTHRQLCAFLESLRGLVPLVLIGHSVPIDTELRQSLAPLTLDETEALLALRNRPLPPTMLVRLHALTGGNPRLIELLAELPLAEDTFALPRSPTLDAFVQRVVQRLDEAERLTVLQLAVFRRAAPADSFAKDMLQRLNARHLVQYDAAGGCSVPGALRGPLLDLAAPELRARLHLQAAAIRAQAGEFSAAAYHLERGHRPDLAVPLLFVHRATEIGQGQAGAALQVLDSIATTQLRDDDREALVLLRAEIAAVLGDYDRAEAEIESISWHNPKLSIAAAHLQGDIADVHDRFTQAVNAYQKALQTSVVLLGATRARLHGRLGRTAMRQKQHDDARHEIQLARFEVEQAAGQLHEDLGDYRQAEECFRAALHIAEQTQSAQEEARSRDNLAAVLARRGHFDAAAREWQRACALLERIGDLHALAGVRVNQAFGYNLAGQHAAAVPAASAALELFTRLAVPTGRAVAAQNLAEATLALGDLDAAEDFARRVVAEEDDATLPDGLRVLGEVALARGMPAAAETPIRQSLAIAQAHNDRYLAAYAWRALARVYTALGRAADAETARTEAQALFAELGLPAEVAQN
jgi:tetratricopeptide (TPR) repeat protein